MGQQEILSQLNDLSGGIKAVLGILREQGNKPASEREFTRTYNLTQAAEILRIKKSEFKAELKNYPDLDESLKNEGARYKLKLDDIHRIGQGIGVIKPKSAIVVSFVQSKGGVGKTTSSCMLTQIQAILGRRVLLVDCDPQGSATSYLGINQDEQIGISETMQAYFSGDQDSLDYAIKKTYFPNVDLVPASMAAYSIEIDFARYQATGDQAQINYANLFLKKGIDKLRDKYDVIVIDSSPSQVQMTANVVCASDLIISPVCMQTLDMGAMVQTLGMIQLLAKTHDLNFVYKILINLYRQQTNAHSNIRALLSKVAGMALYPAPFLNSSLVQGSAAYFKSPFELTPTEMRAKGITSSSKATNELMAAFDQIDETFSQIWMERGEL